MLILRPVNGHDINGLIEILSKVKELKGPVLLHIITKKGKGYPPSENEPTKFHGVGRFNIADGSLVQSSDKPTYTQIFGKTLVELAKKNSSIVAITAAM